jgi:hypothetical protein
MRHPWSRLCSGLIIAFVLSLSEALQTTGIPYVVADDTQPAPPVLLPPSTKEEGVIKPKTDVDPQMEKTPPEPNPDPTNKDVIRPPQDGAVEPK